MRLAAIYLSEASFRIPMWIRKQIRKVTLRRKTLNTCGKKAFLKPEELKYPVMVRVNGNRCEYSCELIYSAYLRASMLKQMDVREKAIRLYKNLKCSNSLGREVKAGEEEKPIIVREKHHKAA